jgi:hypothetical protein
MFEVNPEDDIGTLIGHIANSCFEEANALDLRLDELECNFSTSKIFEIGICGAFARKVIDCHVQMDALKQDKGGLSNHSGENTQSLPVTLLYTSHR